MENAMSVTFTIILGVMVGIFTSAIIYGLMRLFDQVVIPWYSNLIYKGIDLNGRWYCSDYEMTQDVTFDLKQKANTISGTAIFVNKDEPYCKLEDIRLFIVEGFVRDRFVNLVLKHKDNSRLGIICYLLESVGDGRRMDGAISFYSLQDFKIDCGRQTLWREKSRAFDDYDKREIDNDIARQLDLDELVSNLKDSNAKFLTEQESGERNNLS